MSRNRNSWWVALCGCLQLMKIVIDKSISKVGFSYTTWLLNRVDFGGDEGFHLLVVSRGGTQAGRPLGE